MSRGFKIQIQNPDGSEATQCPECCKTLVDRPQTGAPVPLLFVPQEKESHGQAGLAKPWPLSGSLFNNQLQSPRSKSFSTWYTSYLHILLLNYFRYMETFPSFCREIIFPLFLIFRKLFPKFCRACRGQQSGPGLGGWGAHLLCPSPKRAWRLSTYRAATHTNTLHSFDDRRRETQEREDVREDGT